MGKKKPNFAAIFGLIRNAGSTTIAAFLGWMGVRWLGANVLQFLPPFFTADVYGWIGVFIGIVTLWFINYKVGVEVLSPMGDIFGN